VSWTEKYSRRDCISDHGFSRNTSALADLRNRRHHKRLERQSQHRADPRAPWTHRQDVFFRKFQGTHAHSRHEPAGHRDNGETQGADSLRIFGNRTRRTNSAAHGRSGDHGRRARLPALSNRRSSDGRCSHHIRRTLEDGITLGGLSVLSICVRPACRFVLHHFSERVMTPSNCVIFLASK